MRQKSWNKRDAYDALIVGSWPGGCSGSTLPARWHPGNRSDGRTFCGQILDTVDIEKNYISVPKTEGQKLAGALEKFMLMNTTLDVIDSQERGKQTDPGSGVKAACIRLKQLLARY